MTHEQILDIARNHEGPESDGLFSQHEIKYMTNLPFSNRDGWLVTFMADPELITPAMVYVEVYPNGKSWAVPSF